MNDPEELVYVIDLTTHELDRTAHEIDGGGPDPASRPSLPPEPPAPIGLVALLIDGWDEPLILPIEPTRDVRFLDALARLLRIAVLAGERVPSVAVNYGEEYERSLAFSRKLPDWVYSGVDKRNAKALPPEVRLVIGPRSKG